LVKTDLNPLQRKYLRTIDISARSLLRIISDLLDLSRIEAGKMSLDYQVFSVNEMLSDVVALHMPAAAEKDLQLKLEVDKKLPEAEEGDPIRITQVLSNLIGNAIKFTDSGSVSISCKVEEKIDHRLVLKFVVADTGKGIEQRHLSRIFDIFYQVDGSTKRNYSGTGLGLAIAKKLIEMMGGKLELDSQPGEGTAIGFTVVLGLSDQQIGIDDRVHSDRIPSRSQPVRFDRELRVLVVDDNEINRNLASILLTECGTQVDEADCGQLALKKIRESDFDLILMDVHMPQMDGVETTQAIRALDCENAELPVIALTADIIAERREEYLKAGIDDYLAKPIEKNELINILIKWCSTKRRPVQDLPDGLNQKPPVVDNDQAPVLDKELGLRYASGKQTVWKKSLCLLVEKQRSALMALREASAKQDWQTCGDIAHDIKGSARYCGAVALSDAAATLESLARDTRTDQIETAIQLLAEASDLLKDYLIRHHSDAFIS
jgi:CheY-like chemotaxis protein